MPIFGPMTSHDHVFHYYVFSVVLLSLFVLYFECFSLGGLFFKCVVLSCSVFVLFYWFFSWFALFVCRVLFLAGSFLCCSAIVGVFLSFCCFLVLCSFLLCFPVVLFSVPF